MATEATFTFSHVRSVSPPISAPPQQPKPKEHAPAIEQSAASSVLYLLQQNKKRNKLPLKRVKVFSLSPPTQRCQR